MDRSINGEKIQPPPAASKQKPRRSWLFILGQVLLGLLAGLSPVLVAALGLPLVASFMGGLNPSLSTLVTRIFPVLAWIFWICAGIVVVIMFIKAFNKRWSFLASSLPALLVSLAVINIVTAVTQGILLPLAQLSQGSNRSSYVMEQPGQAITDERSGLSLTYLSARKTTGTSNGLIYVTVHIRMTNTSPSQSAFLQSANFFVKSSTHANSSEDALNPEGVVPGYHGNSLLSEKNNPIGPGATIEGDVAFSCFPDQSPDQFGWDPNFGTGQQGVQIYVWKLTFQ